MNDRFIKFWESWMEPDDRIWANPDLLKLWIWCLMSANYTDKRWVSFKSGRGRVDVEIKKGQFVFGRHSAARILGDNPSTVRERMNKLKRLGFIDIQSDRQYSIITICNYEYYQGRERLGMPTETPIKPQASNHTKGQPNDTTKKVKKGKEGKEGKPIISEGGEVQEVFELWNKYAVNGIPRALSCTKSRADKIKARLKENSDIRYWQDVFSKLQKIPFYCGDNDRGWVVTFDYVMKNDTNHVKIAERSIVNGAIINGKPMDAAELAYQKLKRKAQEEHDKRNSNDGN